MSTFLIGENLREFAKLGGWFSLIRKKRVIASARSRVAGDHDDPRFQGTNFDANLKLLLMVQELAQAKNVTAVQIALAWLLHVSADIVPIPGTTKLRHLEENVAASKVALSGDEMHQLATAFASSNISGPRYTEARMRLVDR